MKKRIYATYHRWSDSVEHFGRTGLGRALYLSMLGLVVPFAWVLGFMEFQTSGGVSFNTAWLICFLTLMVSCSVSSRLTWVNALPYEPNRAGASPKKAPVSPEETAKRKAEAEDLAHKESHQEYRAQGTRVIVDAVAFKYGVSRKHLERAPWYRN